MLKSGWLAGATLTVALSLGLSLGGCGFKTPPLPPEAVVPETITDLRATVTENGLILNWSYPRQTIHGRELTRIDSFELYRAEVPVDQVCDNCPIPFGRPLTVTGGEIDREEGRTAHYEYTSLRPNHTYSFKVQARNSWWAVSSDSNTISITWPPADNN
ncbi:MAG: fibronectin type III domain-containing protein [Desulfobulbaceae bacterium]|uniref:Fibronectin type III domain-containing protein n=1 Tax=Candidatus Desulfatifera sulfidica TaxID=2841691 RepID=A0A8J6N8Y4_9BACT|nr:fibronectin type III domain-containing protein [Candidatus Desulfatifera sulfidica]